VSEVTFTGPELHALAVCLGDPARFETVDKTTETGSVVLDALGGDIRAWLTFRDKLSSVHGLAVRMALKAQAELPPPHVRPERILVVVANYFGVRLQLLKGSDRYRVIVRPRMVAMYLMRTLTSLSLPEIGRAIGGRNHATVIHGIRTVQRLRKEDVRFNAKVGELTEKLTGGPVENDEQASAEPARSDWLE
jgi:chromosomal replication initiation ATPase DnaA